jgi:hypothetical protein
VLWSLLRQAIALKGPAQEIADLEDLPFYDLEKLKSLMARKAEWMRSTYLDWPALVHMETIAVCNAACDFCPYPHLERKGERMPDALIEKIIDDLAAIPRDVPFQINPYKVSDPFLEPRLFDILERVNERLPNAEISLITNGAALTDRNVTRLCAIRNVSYVCISLNYDNAEEYEAVMKIPFERTQKRVAALHARKLKGELPFRVWMTRVSDNKLTDLLFLDWAKANYPEFVSRIIPRNDWLGQVATGSAVPEVPAVPCHRWFDLSITATGTVAMCCMDGEAKYPKGDARTTNVLEIYNQPHLRRLRSELISRRAAGDPCNRCTYLNY